MSKVSIILSIDTIEFNDFSIILWFDFFLIIFIEFRAMICINRVYANHLWKLDRKSHCQTPSRFVAARENRASGLVNALTYPNAINHKACSQKCAEKMCDWFRNKIINQMVQITCWYISLYSIISGCCLCLMSLYHWCSYIPISVVFRCCFKICINKHQIIPKICSACCTISFRCELM